jgi:hypothetical protein
MLIRIVTAIVVTLCLAGSGTAAPPNHNGWTRITITPRCRQMLAPPPFANLDGTTEKQPRYPKYLWWNPATAKSMAYKDSRTFISFYVESDGRHVAAIGPDGKLLWVRNPFEDQNLCPYRNARPVISELATTEISSGMADVMQSRGMNPSHKFLEIKFDSSQFGVLDETTGDFFFAGQN